MKKYIWTFWTDPLKDFYINSLMCYALSIALVQRFSKNVLIYTDDKGSELLKRHKIYIPQKIINFDIEPSTYPRFSQAKLKTMLTESEPFCHIDHDVFLFKQQEHWLNYDLTVQNIETGGFWHSHYFSSYHSEAFKDVIFPEEILSCAKNNDFAGFNCGYVDANNLDLVQEWASTGIEISRQYNPTSKIENIVPGQFCLYALAKHKNYKVKTLFLDPFGDESEVVKAGYVHLMGAQEDNYNYTTSRLLDRVREFAPKFYKSISSSDKQRLSRRLPENNFKNKNRFGFGRFFFLVNTQKNAEIKTIYFNQRPIGRLLRATSGFKVLESLNTLFGDIDFSYNENDFDMSEDAKENLIITESLKFFENIHRVAKKHSLNFRVYRTGHGLRMICKNILLNPESEYVQKLFHELCVDPTFGNFATENFSFPARVQPKPKRILENFYKKFSFYMMDSDNQEEWLEKYEKEAKKYKVCEYLHDINGDPSHDITLAECQKIISIHDKLTRCFSSLPLA